MAEPQPPEEPGNIMPGLFDRLLIEVPQARVKRLVYRRLQEPKITEFTLETENPRALMWCFTGPEMALSALREFETPPLSPEGGSL